MGIYQLKLIPPMGKIMNYNAPQGDNNRQV